jgi:Flp pilus assembly protein TadD
VKDPRDRPGLHETISAISLLAIVTVIAYWNSFSGPFVFDDHLSIPQNPTIRTLWPISVPLSPSFNDGRTIDSRPILNLSFAINYAVGGLSIFGLHVGNLLIHILAGLTLFGVCRRTFLKSVFSEKVRASALPLGLLVALTWSVHPLQTSAVTCLVQRAESLMGLFYLLTLYAFVRGADGGGLLWFLVSALACLAGMATKEPMATAPLIVLLYDRTFLAGTFREAWRRRWRWHLTLIATWGLLLWLLVRSGSRGGTAGFGTPMSPWHYAVTQCDAVVRYLKLTFWPSPLVFDYGEGLITDPFSVLPQALLLAALGAMTFYALWRRPVLGFALAWVFLILAPSSSFFPSSHRTIVEHRMYLSLAGLLALVVVSLFFVAGRYRWLTVGAIAAALVPVTIARNMDYRTESELWIDSAEKWPSNDRAFLNAGAALIKEGNPREALLYLTESLRLRPKDTRALENLGNAYAAMKDYPAALEHFQAALEVDGRNASLRANIANVLLFLGRRDEAKEQVVEALRIDPTNAPAHGGHGIILVMEGRTADALVHFEKAVHSEPDSPEYRNNLGMALARLGRRGEAIVEFREAVRLDPNYDQAVANLKAAEKH